MDKTYLSRSPYYDQLDLFNKETTPINHVFGGYFKFTVKCLACGCESATFQHFRNLGKLLCK